MTINESKVKMKTIMYEIISSKITETCKLLVYGINYLQWRNVVEIYVNGRGKKYFIGFPSDFMIVYRTNYLQWRKAKMYVKGRGKKYIIGAPSDCTPHEWKHEDALLYD